MTPYARLDPEFEIPFVMLELAQLLMSIAGFGLPLGIMILMSGRVKLRNELDTLVRVIAAFCTSLVCYWLIGSSIFAGESVNGLFGVGGNIMRDTDLRNGLHDLRIVFLFSIPAILATTALAERGSFVGSTLLSAIVAIFVVPVTAHWAWSVDGSISGWLAAQGFSDDGGAVVIFGAAGFVALAASVTIGPRKDRFPLEATQPRGQSPTYHAFGIVVMVFGLAMISAGQVTNVSVMPSVVFKVLLGASFAATAALLLLVTRRTEGSAMDLMASALAGAVALVAFGSDTSTANAALTGLFAGTATIGLRRVFMALEIDDPGDLIASFLAGGMIGCLLAPLQWMGNGNMMVNQIIMQLISISAISLWSFGITYIAAQILHRFFSLRVSELDEARGLSRVHFGIQSEPDFLFSQVARTNALSRSEESIGQGQSGRLAASFSAQIVKLRNETHRAADRIQSTCDNAKHAQAMIAQIRLAEDTLRVNAEDILMLLESLLGSDKAGANSADFRRWLYEALELLFTPILQDLERFSRHLPLQAELEEVENSILAAASAVARSAHQIELLADFTDVQSDGFFARDHSCDLAQLLGDQTSILTALADTQNSPIQIDCPVKEGLIVSGDSNAFARILYLTVEGALNRLSSRDGMPVRIELREHSSGHYVVLECIDTGTALTGRQVKAIRNPLESDQSLASLGLTQILPLILAVRLARSMGGEVTLSSEQGLGTLLHCRFKVRQAKASNKPSKAA